MKDWKVFADKHFSLLDGVCIEALLLDLYLGRDWDPPTPIVLVASKITLVDDTTRVPS